MTKRELGATARAESAETSPSAGAGAATTTLLTDASASAAETEETMRVKENISRTLNEKGVDVKSRLADWKNVKTKASNESGGEVL